MTSIESKLKELMQEKNLSVAQVAESSGITRSSIHSILSGSNDNPSSKTLLKISKVLGVSLDYFLGHDIKTNIDIMTKEQLQVFRGICNSTLDIIIKQNHALSLELFFKIIKEVSSYTFSAEPIEVNTKFINYAINKILKLS